MNRQQSTRRQIMFDLDTKVMEKILGTKYTNVYKNIEQYLKEKGFSHPQGSGYISDKAISNSEMFDIIIELKEKYPYIEKCVRDIRVANIIDVNSLNYFFDYDGTPGKYAAQEKDVKREDVKSSLLENLSIKNKQAKQQNSTGRNTQIHNHNNYLD